MLLRELNLLFPVLRYEKDAFGKEVKLISASHFITANFYDPILLCVRLFIFDFYFKYFFEKRSIFFRNFCF